MAETWQGEREQQGGADRSRSRTSPRCSRPGGAANRAEDVGSFRALVCAPPGAGVGLLVLRRGTMLRGGLWQSSGLGEVPPAQPAPKRRLDALDLS